MCSLCKKKPREKQHAYLGPHTSSVIWLPGHSANQLWQTLSYLTQQSMYKQVCMSVHTSGCVKFFYCHIYDVLMPSFNKFNSQMTDEYCYIFNYLCCIYWQAWNYNRFHRWSCLKYILFFFSKDFYSPRQKQHQ